VYGGGVAKDLKSADEKLAIPDRFFSVKIEFSQFHKIL